MQFTALHTISFEKWRRYLHDFLDWDRICGLAHNLLEYALLEGVLTRVSLFGPPCHV
jgi:hypothetical protein